MDKKEGSDSDHYSMEKGRLWLKFFKRTGELIPIWITFSVRNRLA